MKLTKKERISFFFKTEGILISVRLICGRIYVAAIQVKGYIFAQKDVNC